MITIIMSRVLKNILCKNAGRRTAVVCVRKRICEFVHSDITFSIRDIITSTALTDLSIKRVDIMGGRFKAHLKYEIAIVVVLCVNGVGLEIR